MSHTIKEEFALLYYDWARKEFAQELQQGWPLLRKVRSRLLIRAIREIESKGASDQEELIRSMLKRFHPVAAKLLGDEMTEREREVFEASLLARLNPSPEEGVLEAAGPMDKRKFMRHAKEALRRVLGTDIQKAAPDEEWFFTTLGPARLKTIVSYEREPSYDQHLHVNDELVLKWASVFSWLGIAGQTTFDLIPRGEEEAAAELLAELCGHFLKAAQEIVGQMKTLA